MKAEDLKVDITARLYAKNIQDLRTIARAVGVRKPTDRKKDDLVNDILSYADGSFNPPPRSVRGAPPKDRSYDVALVSDINQCRKIYNALKRGEVFVRSERTLSVSDGLFSEGKCSGILERGDRRWFLHVNGNRLAGASDVFVQESFLHRFALREGDLITGYAERLNEEQGFGLVSVESIDGYAPDAVPERGKIELLTPVYPDRAIVFSTDLAGRMIDLFAPLGAGQRAVIAGDARTGKTQLINEIGAGICRNYAQFVSIALALGARPEEVTELHENLAGGEVFSTGAEESVFSHVHAARLVLSYAKRRVEFGRDVVLLVDGLERLLSSDENQSELSEVVRLLSSAGNFKEGASLTIIATVETEQGRSALLESAEKTANMCLYLSAEAARNRLYPALDLRRSFSAKSERLLTADEIAAATALRTMAEGEKGFLGVRNLFLQTANNAALVEKIKG